MKAAIMLLKFGRNLEAAWKRETTKLKEPPSTKVVVDFLDDQLTSISGTREEVDHIQPFSHPLSGKQIKKTVHKISAPTAIGSCPACSSTGYSLARCNGYRNWGIKRKNDLGPQSVLQLPSSWPQNLCLHQQRNLSRVQKEAPHHSA